MRSPVIPEIEIVRNWQRRMELHRKFITDGGEIVEILYPGRPNDDRGGDFRDAVILLGRDVKRGNIEVHSCTSGWEAHNHHLDPYYNQVILHVAWQRDNNSRVFLENGQSVPTVVLDKDPFDRAKEGEKLPCQRSKTKNLGNILEELGETRLTEKVERFKLDLLNTESGQVFYTGLLEALGYSKNKQPFLKLACLVPLRDLNKFSEDRLNKVSVQSFLLGSAGLLPSQRNLENCDDRYVYELEKNWIDNGYKQLMSHRDWEYYKVRPINSPVRRVIAVSEMFFRFQRLGWLETWRRVLVQVVKYSKCVDLEALLRVKAEGYWCGRYDFYPHSNVYNDWLIGNGRSREIIINVVFPFFKAWGEQIGEYDLISGLNTIIRCYPPCGTNSIQRHMLNQLRANRGLANSALKQQGLLHLYKSYCSLGRCFSCLLNK